MQSWEIFPVEEKTKEDSRYARLATPPLRSTALRSPIAETVPESSQTIVLGGGCFWCTEAVFCDVTGVVHTEVGYAGGFTEDPTYEEVCGGGTGHAEVLKLEYDPAQISLDKVLEVFFKMHDPTSVDRQGNDVGSQYRSIILFQSEEQLPAIKKALADQSRLYLRPVVTQVERLKDFYPAEEYHQRYFEKHPTASYCAFVVRPKVEKIRSTFPEFTTSDSRRI